jgi:hypothetical protein
MRSGTAIAIMVLLLLIIFAAFLQFVVLGR